jgi:Ca2+-binding EF-hand superfamily protein
MTYFFLKGLQGEADTNKDGKIDIAEMFEYLRPQVERVARRDFNSEQTPLLLGNADVLAQGVYLQQ